ncbi:MAG: mannose-6-phosphate isomerase, class I [Sphaerochaetaceae bacterium]|jgi:mannose-6-phosphate isomerase|nr:mannose-6-phosphate isomerase, class I [Sphaerochaetaceae bacterium]
MDFVMIEPVLKASPWGTRRFLSELSGIQSDAERIGEMWMGTHPSGTCRIPNYPNGNLSDFLRSNPIWGQKTGKLDFLFKVLSIENPLSIQVHPDAQTARLGYEAETLKRLSTPPSQCNYQDANPKAEMLCALSRTTAMVGFLPIARIKANLRRVIPSFCQAFDECQTIESFFKTLYHMDKARLAPMIQALKANLEKEDDGLVSAFLTAEQIALKCIKDYPEDPGVLAPFFLNVAWLNPGEALYLSPGVLHSYVYGTIVELMNNSDNVLRAGLTPKHMDLDELEKVTRFESFAAINLETSTGPDGIHYIAPDADFELVRLKGGCHEGRQDLVQILLCYEGTASLKSKDQTLTLTSGKVALISADAKDYTIDISDGGLGFLASASRRP